MDSDASQNHFERVPDDILRLILNRVLDAKSLCACLAVSTRFNSLALQSTSLSLSVDRVHFDDDDDSDPAAPETSLLRSILRFLISRPLRFFLNRLRTHSALPQAAVFYSPAEALRSFSRIEVLKIQLPSHGELQLHPPTNSLLKWKATFGAELKACVIIAGTSLDHILRQNSDGDIEEGRPSLVLDAQPCGNKDQRASEGGRGRRTEPSFPMSNEDLKTRVVWTISCLIAASSRHHLLKRIIAQHPMLKSIEMVDEQRQGTLTMAEADISLMRTTLSDSNHQDESSTDRTRIPALKMKMWHAPELELPGCGQVMKGATLIVIRAANELDGAEEMFESVYGEAAREIRRKISQSYSLEMESF